ncbi:MAG: hypothetical protein AAGJ31_03145 [Verrucomicrobiota bacterium]
MMFSLAFVQILIVLALIWTGLGAVTLVTLLVIDWRKGNLW